MENPSRLETPKVSVIIPFYKNRDYLKQAVTKCLQLDYEHFEIIVVANQWREPQLQDDRIRIVLTEKVSKAHKMAIGVKNSKGVICAFLDDDAFPPKDWLRNAVRHLSDTTVAVGGPGIACQEDKLTARAARAAMGTWIGSGMLSYRFKPANARYVSELPASNLIVKKEFVAVELLETDLRSGDDTLLCHFIVSCGYKILYSPDVFVYHHSRPLFKPHFKQIFTYGLHRGFFIRTKTRTSLSLPYLTPLLVFGICLTLILASLTAHILIQFLIASIAIYALLCFFTTIVSATDLTLAALATVTIPVTHLAYALGYFRGLLSVDVGSQPSY